MQHLSFDSSPNMPTKTSIHTQRKKLYETRKLNRSLEQECAQNEAILSQLRSILSAAEDSKKPIRQAGEEATSRHDLDLSFLTSSPAARQLQVGSAAGTNNNNTRRTPFTSNMTFILSQLPALQEALNGLLPKLETLPKSANEVQYRKDERQEYIESRIRLHLERTGQLVDHDENPDDPVVSGRRIDPAEAQALESVTGHLSDQRPE